MKARLLSVLVAAVIAGVAVYSPSAETQIGAEAGTQIGIQGGTQTEPDQIDFASLHSQAAGALLSLQCAQDRRAAPQDTAATF